MPHSAVQFLTGPLSARNFEVRTRGVTVTTFGPPRFSDTTDTGASNPLVFDTGVTFRSVVAPVPNLYVATPGGAAARTYFRVPLASNVLTSGGNEEIDIEFAAPPTAVGLDYYTNGYAPLTVAVFDTTGAQLGTYDLAGGDPSAHAGFLGILSDRPIAKVSWRATNGGTIDTGFANVRFGSVVHRVFQSLIQSDFAPDPHPNFEAVVVTWREGDCQLTHWYRDNSLPAKDWKQGLTVVPSGVAGPGALIRSDFVSGGHGNFEVVVPITATSGRVELWHYYHDNGDAKNPWVPVRRVTGPDDDVAFPAALIQSDYRPGGNGNFEVVVPLRSPSGRVELHHFYHDNSDPAGEWQPGGRVTRDGDDVAGPAALIQSDFVTGGHGNFEVVVPLKAAAPSAPGLVELWHFVRDTTGDSTTWSAVTAVRETTGPGTLIQSDFMTGGHGNFEVLAPVGNRLVHLYREFDAGTNQFVWRDGQVVTESLSGWASLMRSDYGVGANKNFEALIEESGDSVIGYWHPNNFPALPPDVNPRLPWVRDKPLAARSVVPAPLAATRKLEQLTGDNDLQGWAPSGPGRPDTQTANRTRSRTETRFGVIGTDLGSSFVHGDKTFFLFGDTTGRPDNMDSIATTAATADPDHGLTLEFVRAFPVISPPVPQDAFNVPLDGVSHGDLMYVFFSTENYPVDDTSGSRNLMGVSLLTRSPDGGGFEKLYVFSRDKFINVSVQPYRLDPALAQTIGIEPDVLCIWGSGRYRSSDVYLALLPLSQLATGGGRRFYAGRPGGTDRWSGNEDDAAPLFCAGCVGELSARWNPYLSRFLITFNSDNPRGIVLHAAKTPWGPWTAEPILVFDPFHISDPVAAPHARDGYGRFMHLSWDFLKKDLNDPAAVGDFLHLDPAAAVQGIDENSWGGEYGPYQIGHMAKGVSGQSTQLYFLMSTWIPYQATLMTTTVTAELIRSYET